MKQQVKQSELKSQLHEKETAEKRIHEMKEDQARSAAQAKVLIISAGYGPWR